MTDHLQGLVPGFRLREYEVRSTLGSCELGFKYLGFDHDRKEQIAILEYLPSSMAVRYGPTAVMPNSSGVETRFRELLGQFLEEASALAQFQHPNMIRVRRILQTNGTGYVVMDYAEGRTLSAILRRGGTLGNDNLDAILNPVLEVLEELHRRQLLHQDIRPGNIVVRTDHSPLLLASGAIRQGHGAARRAFGDQWKNRHADLSPSVYAPLELYSNNSKPGPWSDIYSLGATLYHCVTGSIPPAAPERILRETVTSLSSDADRPYPAGTLSATDAALAIRPEDRPQSIAAWREILSGASRRQQGHSVRTKTARTAARGARLSADADAESTETPGRQPRWMVPALALTAVTAFIVYLDTGVLRPPGDHPALSGPTSALAADSAPVQLEIAQPLRPVQADTGAAGRVGGASLVVETDPPAVEVLVAGQLVGETPLHLSELATGVFDITLRHIYYETVELADQAFESTRALRIERTLTRATGELMVTTEPSGAWVELNNRRGIERTPGTLRNLPAGPIQITLGAPGHVPTKVLVEVPKGGVGYLTHVLQTVEVVGDTRERIALDSQPHRK